MRWGCALTTYHPASWSHQEVFARSLEFARVAEALGFADVWLFEHHFTEYGLCPNALMMAAYILGHTQRIRAGTAVIVAPFEHPIRLAEQIAMVDQLSNGRMMPGFGRGVFAKDFETFGVDSTRSHAMMREWIDIQIAAWTHESVSWKSDLIQFEDVSVKPETFSKPYPPIYVVAESGSTIEFAASRGIPVIMIIRKPLDRMRASIELYADVAISHGHDPSRIRHAIATPTHVADTHESAVAEIVDSVTEWHEAGGRSAFTTEQLRTLPNYRFQWSQFQDAILGGARSARDIVKQALSVAPVGSPQECIAKIEELREVTGVDHFILGFEGSKQRENIIASMTRFAEEVAPKLEVETEPPGSVRRPAHEQQQQLTVNAAR